MNSINIRYNILQILKLGHFRLLQPFMSNRKKYQCKNLFVFVVELVITYIHEQPILLTSALKVLVITQYVKNQKVLA